MVDFIKCIAVLNCTKDQMVYNYSVSFFTKKRMEKKFGKKVWYVFIVKKVESMNQK